MNQVTYDHLPFHQSNLTFSPCNVKFGIIRVHVHDREQCRESWILSSILKWHKVCLWAFCYHSFGHLWDMARLQVDSELHKDTCYHVIGPRDCNMGLIMSNLLSSKFSFYKCYSFIEFDFVAKNFRRWIQRYLVWHSWPLYFP